MYVSQVTVSSSFNLKTNKMPSQQSDQNSLHHHKPNLNDSINLISNHHSSGSLESEYTHIPLKLRRQYADQFAIIWWWRKRKKINDISIPSSFKFSFYWVLRLMLFLLMPMMMLLVVVVVIINLFFHTIFLSAQHIFQIQSK